MKFLLLAGIILTSFNPSFAQNDPAKKQVELAASNEVKAIEASDVVALGELWSPKIVITSGNGRQMTRDEVLDSMLADKGRYSISNTVMDSDTIFGDVAVTTGSDEVETKIGPNAGHKVHRRFTKVWQRSGDVWLQVARHTSVDARPAL